MKHVLLRVAALASMAAFAACSSNKADKPTPLVKIENRIDIKRVWHASVGGEKPKLRLGLGLAVDGNRVFAASYSGSVEAFDLATGRRLWRREVRAPLSGGPGAADGLVVVGAAKGQIVALAESDGAVRWRTRINAEILSAPAVGGGIVLVHGVDGRLHGLMAANGSESWVIDQQVPRLSLRGSGRPAVVGDLAVCGFDNGRVVAVSLASGAAAWEAAAGQSRGSTELQRLIDVDSSIVVADDDLFAVAYQGRVVRLARETGQIIWGRDLSSYRGLAVDSAAVYVSSSEGDVVRHDRASGAEQWRQKALERRMLSAPVVYGGDIVVGDLDGVIHWLDPANGAFLARASGGKRISSPPVVAGGLLLTFSDFGEINAFRTASGN